MGSSVLPTAATGGEMPTPAQTAVPRTHSHNDYERPHPLFDALHAGMSGVEADIWLVGDDLRVAHEPAVDWSKKPTLQKLYLDPLRDLHARRAGPGFYADGTPILLLIDIKSHAEKTYARLHDVLAAYAAKSPGLLTTFTRSSAGNWQNKPGAITVVVSGNRPAEAMRKQATRYAGYDGRLADLDGRESADFMPLISDNWNTLFTGEADWSGDVPISEKAAARLKEFVAAAHAQSKKVRLWNLPNDGPTVWDALYDAGVDYINTDHVAELAEHIRKREP